MGRRDFKTTLIYADYAPSAHEGEMVERAFRGLIGLSAVPAACGVLVQPAAREASAFRKVEGLLVRVPRTPLLGCFPRRQIAVTGIAPASRIALSLAPSSSPSGV